MFETGIDDELILGISWSFMPFYVDMSEFKSYIYAQLPEVNFVVSTIVKLD